MILRKPYAFLIKKFKLIHIIMTIMMMYLAYKTNIAVGYFNEYINSNTLLREPASNYFNTLMFIIIVFIITLASVVHYLLRYKKKPRTTYIVTIIGYLFSLIIFYNAFSVLKELETTMLEAKTIRLWRDLLTFSLYYQYVMIIIMLIRALGFDIKKFNFQTDLKELEIDTVDNEEFEFILDDNNHKLSRNIRKALRKLKYFIVENKFILSIILGITISIFTIVLIINITITNKVYKENQSFLTSNYQMSVTNSYYTKFNSQGNYITTKDDTYLIINLNVKSLHYKDTLKLTDFRIIIDNNKYYPTVKYCDSLNDLGKCYNKQKITNQNTNYLLIYKLPKKYDSLTLYYESEVTINTAGIESKYKKVKLSPIDLDKILSTSETNLNSPHNINNIFIQNTSMSIIDYDINDTFFHTYQKCINKNCQTKTEVIAVNNIATTNKTILKLKVEYSGTIPLNNLIKRYMNVEYKINNETHYGKITNRTPENQNEYIFVEVNDNIATAEKIMINLNIRNYIYKYKLK